MNKLNFSWLINDEVAGHAEPKNTDDLQWLYQQGIRALVRMSTQPKVTVTEVKQVGMDDLYEPVADFTPPSPEQLKMIVKFISSSVKANKPVGVSCGAGYGRTGTVLACYLVSHGYPAVKAIQEVRLIRPGSVETTGQEEAVGNFALEHKLKVK